MVFKIIDLIRWMLSGLFVLLFVCALYAMVPLSWKRSVDEIVDAASEKTVGYTVLKVGEKGASSLGFEEEKNPFKPKGVKINQTFEWLKSTAMYVFFGVKDLIVWISSTLLFKLIFIAAFVLVLGYYLFKNVLPVRISLF